MVITAVAPDRAGDAATSAAIVLTVANGSSLPTP
jgi:hypothetical protein